MLFSLMSMQIVPIWLFAKLFGSVECFATNNIFNGGYDR